jgi:hypothetical protein
MSSAAAWANTARATLWPLLGRDDWEQVETFGPPVGFDCDYTAKSERRTDAKGVEFVTRQVIYTERADIKQGDRVLIGEVATVDPIAAGALEVRATERFGDTFDRTTDDWVIYT